MPGNELRLWGLDPQKELWALKKAMGHKREVWTLKMRIWALKRRLWALKGWARCYK